MALVTIDQAVIDGIVTELTTIETEVQALVASEQNNLQPADVSGITTALSAISASLTPAPTPVPAPAPTPTP